MKTEAITLLISFNLFIKGIGRIIVEMKMHTFDSVSKSMAGKTPLFASLTHLLLRQDETKTIFTMYRSSKNKYLLIDWPN